MEGAPVMFGNPWPSFSKASGFDLDLTGRAAGVKYTANFNSFRPSKSRFSGMPTMPMLLKRSLCLRMICSLNVKPDSKDTIAGQRKT